MKRGKAFNVYLMDGDVTGSMKCTLSNWTGVAYKIPRTHLNESKNRPHLKQSGVYFLFGVNDNGEGEVYIGQAGARKNGEGILMRVVEHLRDDAYFNDAIMFTTQNNSFGPTEISYLENRFTNLARDIGRYHVRNGNDPNPGNVTEEKQAELEDFIEYSQMVLGVLGYKVFVPLDQQQAKVEMKAEREEKSDELQLYLSHKDRKNQRIMEAHCLRTSEGFVLLKGSEIRENVLTSASNSLKKLRLESFMNGTITDNILTRNLLFTSPSSAAGFVLGMSVNGKEKWKTQSGQSLNEYEEDELNKISVKR